MYGCMGPETGNNPCGWPVTSAFDIWYILADILRCPHNDRGVATCTQIRNCVPENNNKK